MAVIWLYAGCTDRVYEAYVDGDTDSSDERDKDDKVISSFQ